MNYLMIHDVYRKYLITRGFRFHKSRAAREFNRYVGQRGGIVRVPLAAFMCMAPAGTPRSREAARGREGTRQPRIHLPFARHARPWLRGQNLSVWQIAE